MDARDLMGSTINMFGDANKRKADEIAPDGEEGEVLLVDLTGEEEAETPEPFEAVQAVSRWMKRPEGQAELLHRVSAVIAASAATATVAVGSAVAVGALGHQGEFFEFDDALFLRLCVADFRHMRDHLLEALDEVGLVVLLQATIRRPGLDPERLFNFRLVHDSRGEGVGEALGHQSPLEPSLGGFLLLLRVWAQNLLNRRVFVLGSEENSG
ncbi:hypothetical protein H310_05676 [Aphanomyces invadans]|uniref:Uncharacterized protein n=1 Tax=Aphanomyces invadans TaxID=157072 RepID=A0A024U716_9STRA|nr:hypothetical protein H310_05676 [Aphanomyces invadans]ETW02064.1 hypothetical protein H310_05676 [Aphanomyces invadans]|eukprot:XP_008868669.1 hypothetical protein H310_05676 [Aphanomyces invadans]